MSWQLRSFALVVFCDGPLQRKPAHGDPGEVDLMKKFFFVVVASKLAMELQMVLCHGVFGPMKEQVCHPRFRGSLPNQTDIDAIVLGCHFLFLLISDGVIPRALT